MAARVLVKIRKKVESVGYYSKDRIAYGNDRCAIISWHHLKKWIFSIRKLLEPPRCTG